MLKIVTYITIKKKTNKIESFFSLKVKDTKVQS